MLTKSKYSRNEFGTESQRSESFPFCIKRDSFFNHLIMLHLTYNFAWCNIRQFLFYILPFRRIHFAPRLAR